MTHKKYLLAAAALATSIFKPIIAEAEADPTDILFTDTKAGDISFILCHSSPLSCSEANNLTKTPEDFTGKEGEIDSIKDIILQE